jgi:hypothetical protein
LQHGPLERNHAGHGKHGYTVRRLEIGSEVIISSLAYLDHVGIGGVQVVKVESHKPSGQCGGKNCGGLFRPMSYHRRRRWLIGRFHLELRDLLLLAGIEELEVLLAKALDRFDLGEILVYGDIAVVRLIWTLDESKQGSTVTVRSSEPGMDIFQRQKDGSWKIIRYLAYTSPE